MVSKEEKRRRAALVEAIVTEETKKATEEMPLSLKELGRIFDHLDEQLAIEGCDHTPKVTSAFIVGIKLNPGKILPWLQEQGGYCDCEILGNVEENWGSKISKNS